MNNIITELSRPVRRRLKKVVQFNTDGNYRRRAEAILLLHQCYSRKLVSQLLNASRTSIRKWVQRFEQFGESALFPENRGRTPYSINETISTRLLELFQKQPKEFGCFNSRWTSELLTRQVNEEFQTHIHSSTIRRLLPKPGIKWKRASPTLCIQDKEKALKIKMIEKALQSANAEHSVFYVDEADVDLNPRIGSFWSVKGQQTRIPTPGKNQKNYLAGALNAKTGQVVWVEWESKNSFLFLRLMAELRKRYRQAKTIRLIADNYVIHKSQITKTFLSHNKKFELIFQPAYHPRVNRIELLWKQLHDTVTRNHRHSTMKSLMEDVRKFMNNVSPFPGSEIQQNKVIGWTPFRISYLETGFKMNLDRVTTGNNVPNEFNVIIEIPSHSDPVKYEVDKETGAMFVDRFIGTAMVYPCNYGYIPHTLSDDGDAVDVLVVTPLPLQFGSVIQCRPIGMLLMEDEAGLDAKVLAVPIDKLTGMYTKISSFRDMPNTLLDTLAHFFAHYKDLEPGKWVKIKSWVDVEDAKTEILESIERYQNAPDKPYF